MVEDLAVWATHWADQDEEGCGCRMSSTVKNSVVGGKTVTTNVLRNAIKAGCVDFDLLVGVFGPRQW